MKKRNKCHASLRLSRTKKMIEVHSQRAKRIHTPECGYIENTRRTQALTDLGCGHCAHLCVIDKQKTRQFRRQWTSIFSYKTTVTDLLS